VSGGLPSEGPRQLALFAFFLVSANRRCRSMLLVDAVWGAERHRSGERLQMAIARLRRALAPLEHQRPLLETASGGYLLSLAPGALDAEVFQCQIRDGQRALQARDPAQAGEQLTQELGLFDVPRSRRQRRPSVAPVRTSRSPSPGRAWSSTKRSSPSVIRLVKHRAGAGAANRREEQCWAGLTMSRLASGSPPRSVAGGCLSESAGPLWQCR
jgi:hypothetical protein